MLDDSNITSKEYASYLKAAKDAGYMVAVVDMPHPDLEEAQKKNAYGIKEEVLKDMIARWEPFILNRLKEKTTAIPEKKPEEEEDS